MSKNEEQKTLSGLNPPLGPPGWDVGGNVGTGVHANGLSVYSERLGGDVAWFNTNGSVSVNNKLSINGGTYFDYYEGTWTPGAEYSWQYSPIDPDFNRPQPPPAQPITISSTGTWVKIGRQVTANFHLVFNYPAFLATSVGYPIIFNGLPFPIDGGITCALDSTSHVVSATNDLSIPDNYCGPWSASAWNNGVFYNFLAGDISNPPASSSKFIIWGCNPSYVFDVVPLVGPLRYDVNAPMLFWPGSFLVDREDQNIKGTITYLTT